MKLKHIYLLPVQIMIICLMGYSEVCAQESDFDTFSLNENIPKSPEAASLGQYGDIANNPYNGKANVSIPIYNLNFEGLQIPIQLSYDSGGIKVASEASWVGLNWSLSTNFGISRQINAVDDFRPNGYINNSYSVTGPTLSFEDIRDIHESFLSYGGPSNEIDMQPDIFDVNLFGMSYKFRLNKKGATNTIQGHVFNNKNVIIEYDLTNGTFQITDERGFVFDFETRDYSTTFQNGNAYNVTEGAASSIVTKSSAQDNLLVNPDVNKANETVVTSWYLDKITSPNYRVLDLTYRPGAYFTFPSVNGVVRVSDTGSNFITNTTELPVPVSGVSYSTSTTIVENHYLEKISGDFGEVNFILGSRQDLLTGNDLNNLLGPNNTMLFITANGQYRECHGIATCHEDNHIVAHKLEGIEIKNSQDDLIVDADFNYSYYNEDENTGSDKTRFIRLKLDKVLINDQNYFFNYEQPDALPAKDSFDVDFWGFYNGAGNDANNLGNVPSIGRFITSDINAGGYLHIGQSYFNYDGANRGSNFDFGKIGLLTRVVYPTGGYTSLCYEAHDAVIEAPQPYLVTEDFNFVGVDRYQWTNMLDEAKYKFTYQYLKKASKPNYNFFDNEFVQSSNAVETSITLGEEFTVTSTSLIRTSATLKTLSSPDVNGNFVNERARFIQNMDDSDDVSIIFSYGDWPAPINLNATNDTSIKDGLVILAPGTYKILGENAYIPGLATPVIQVLENENSSSDSPYTLVTFPQGSGVNLSDLYETFEIGGARIASVSNYDNNNAFISKTVYEYKNPDATDPNLTSSGKLMDELIYFSKAYGFHSYNPRGYNASPLQLTSSNPLRINPAAQGSHIGYSHTTERTVDIANNTLGRIERSFFNKENTYQTQSFCRLFRASACTPPTEYDACIYNTYLLGLDSKNSFGYSNGNLLNEKVYSNNGELVRLTENIYENLTGNNDPLTFASFMHYGVAAGGNNHCGIPYGSDNTTYVTYKYPPSFSLKSVLVESKVTDKFAEDITSTQIQTYNPDTHHLEESTAINSRGEEIKSRYFYPYDTEVASENHMSTLIAANRIAAPIKTDTYIKDHLQSSQIVNYANNQSTRNIPQPAFVEFAKAIDESTLGTYESRFKYEEYGPFGKIRQARSEEGVSMVYIWGHNNRHVVAKIENATFDQVEAILGDDFNPGNAGLNPIDENALRSNLTDAMITTYTYKPLVGVTSIKNPKGYVMNYIYDNANRLIEVRDQDNNLISDYDYEYVDLQQN